MERYGSLFCEKINFAPVRHSWKKQEPKHRIVFECEVADSLYSSPLATPIPFCLGRPCCFCSKFLHSSTPTCSSMDVLIPHVPTDQHMQSHHSPSDSPCYHCLLPYLVTPLLPACPCNSSCCPCLYLPTNHVELPSHLAIKAIQRKKKGVGNKGRGILERKRGLAIEAEKGKGEQKMVFCS